ncbi:excinuclease ABC subunit UvrC [candidate division KSB1 bacterium]
MAFKEKLKNIPDKPGVYLFRNKKDEILYIGKARILKNRVKSYFQSRTFESPKTETLVKKIDRIETIVTDNEVEALILEANLVKEHKPRYNIDLKDDKSFPFVRITNERFPKVFLTRKVVKDGSKYFGPYTNVKSIRDSLHILKKIFPLRQCNKVLSEKAVKEGKFKPCLNFHINKCLGPCISGIDNTEYNEMINQVILFLNGKTKTVIEILQAKMDEKVKILEFEKAALYRDRIKLIKNFDARQKVVSTDFTDRDIFAVYKEDDLACGVLLKVREGKALNLHHFYMSGVEYSGESEIMKSLIQQYYLNSDTFVDEILLSAELEDISSFKEWFEKIKNERIKINTPKKGEKSKLVEMCKKNAKFYLDELKLQKLKDADYTPRSVRALERDLKLQKTPRVIEAFDISNISGKDAAASMVYFNNAIPKKSEYRRFKIKSKTTPDDYAMMREAVKRRYKRMIDEKRDLPDLILIDGGKGQLSAAFGVLKELNLESIQIIGLAKRLEEVYLPEKSEPLGIPKTSSGLRLLQRIRDESHRFAINYHRQLRSKRTIKSELDDIPGIGDNRRKLLLKHFGSVKKIKNSSVNDLKNVKGIPEKVAEDIYRRLHK